MFPDTRKEATS